MWVILLWAAIGGASVWGGEWGDSAFRGGYVPGRSAEGRFLHDCALRYVEARACVWERRGGGQVRELRDVCRAELRRADPVVDRSGFLVRAISSLESGSEAGRGSNSAAIRRALEFAHKAAGSTRPRGEQWARAALGNAGVRAGYVATLTRWASAQEALLRKMCEVPREPAGPVDRRAADLLPVTGTVSGGRCDAPVVGFCVGSVPKCAPDRALMRCCGASDSVSGYHLVAQTVVLRS